MKRPTAAQYAWVAVLCVMGVLMAWTDDPTGLAPKGEKVNTVTTQRVAMPSPDPALDRPPSDGMLPLRLPIGTSNQVFTVYDGGEFIIDLAPDWSVSVYGRYVGRILTNEHRWEPAPMPATNAPIELESAKAAPSVGMTWVNTAYGPRLECYDRIYHGTNAPLGHIMNPGWIDEECFLLSHPALPHSHTNLYWIEARPVELESVKAVSKDHKKEAMQRLAGATNAQPASPKAPTFEDGVRIASQLATENKAYAMFLLPAERVALCYRVWLLEQRGAK